jgi:hypothetical protein
MAMCEILSFAGPGYLGTRPFRRVCGVFLRKSPGEGRDQGHPSSKRAKPVCPTHRELGRGELPRDVVSFAACPVQERPEMGLCHSRKTGSFF